MNDTNVENPTAPAPANVLEGITGIVAADQLPRIWSIEEQIVECPITRMRLEFTSAYSQAVASGLTGDALPVHDGCLLLAIYNDQRTKVVEMTFDRNGLKGDSTIWDAAEYEARAGRPVPVATEIATG